MNSAYNAPRSGKMYSEPLLEVKSILKDTDSATSMISSKTSPAVGMYDPEDSLNLLHQQLIFKDQLIPGSTGAPKYVLRQINERKVNCSFNLFLIREVVFSQI
jgi:hypothetical protein